MLHKWILEHKGEPSLAATVCYRLDEWHHEPSLSPLVPSLTPTLNTAVAAQDEIGWQNFFEGRVSIYWAETQEIYLQSIGSKKSGTKWMARLIKEIWITVALTQWKHRCGILHGHDKYDEMTGMADIDAQIQSLYEKGADSLSPLDQGLIRGNSLPSILKMTTAQRKQWLACVETAKTSKLRTDLRQIDRYHDERIGLARWVLRN